MSDNIPIMNPSEGPDTVGRPEETLARLEQRLARVEAMLGLEPDSVRDAGPPAEAPPGVRSASAVGELEAAVGQQLFANIGIVVLAIGGALALSMPWQEVPPVLPSACGWVLAGVLFLLARWMQASLPLIGKGPRRRWLRC